MSRSARTGQVVLTLMGVLSAVIAVSVYTVPDPFPSDANALIATFGVGYGGFLVVLATVGLSWHPGLAWPALWIVPAFFASHVLLLGTWLPDALFFLVTCAALAATARTRQAATSRDEGSYE